MHQRLNPRKHRFRYRVFSLLFDLEELPELDRRLPLFGYNRFSLFSFNDRDHGPCDGSPLRPWIDAQLAYGDDKGKKAVAAAKALMEKYGGEERVE